MNDRKTSTIVSPAWLDKNAERDELWKILSRKSRKKKKKKKYNYVLVFGCAEVVLRF
jgi:hypothetical protein